MSPELFSSRPYGKESDVWALGCCTFEMMTRRHAFNARDLDSLAIKVLHGKAPKMPQSYSKRLTDLVLRMLSFESEQRPTVSEILQQRFVRFRLIMSWSLFKWWFRDRIKIFLARQRPHSGKSSRKSSSRPSSGKTPVAQGLDVYTMLPTLIRTIDEFVVILKYDFCIIIFTSS